MRCVATRSSETSWNSARYQKDARDVPPRHSRSLRLRPHVVAFDEDRQAWCPVDEVGWEHTQFAVYVWRSVRKTDDTKTVKSRRSLRLPDRCVAVLEALKIEQDRGEALGAVRNGERLVFCTKSGTALSAGNARRDFRAVLDRAELVGREWTPRELRHSFLSLLSAHDVPIENISRLVGHTNTVVTERVYRKQIRPVIQEGQPR
jgi:integrase